MDNLIKYHDLNNNLDKLEVFSYLPHSIKKRIVNTILDICISENENGLKIVDYCLLEMVKKFKLINEYTNIDFSGVDVLVAFDEMSKSGVLDQILERIPKKELEFFDVVINKEIEQIYKVDNSLENVLVNVLNKLIDKLPDDKQLKSLSKTLIKEVNKLDPEKFSFLVSAINFNNGIKPKSGGKNASI